MDDSDDVAWPEAWSVVNSTRTHLSPRRAASRSSFTASLPFRTTVVVMVSFTSALAEP